VRETTATDVNFFGLARSAVSTFSLLPPLRSVHIRRGSPSCIDTSSDCNRLFYTRSFPGVQDCNMPEMYVCDHFPAMPLTAN
jgi:hypothetical protein